MVSPLVQALAYQGSVNPVPSSVNPTNVVGAYQLASDVAEKNYQAQIAKQNAFWGGLAGLGGAGVLAFGRPAASKLFGGTPAAAATPGGVTASPLAAVTGGGDTGGILTGGQSLGISPGAFAAQPGLAGADASMSGPLASLMGSSAAPSIAGDFGLAGAGGLAGSADSVAAGLGAGAGTDALASAGAAAGADAGAFSLADLLPLLALA
jgi:hypothetical protein